MHRMLRSTTLILLASFANAGYTHASPAGLVAQIRQADYEGNRPALRQLYEQLTPFLHDQNIASRVRYWRGFALWRRALNGFNDSVDPNEIERDLQSAAVEFEQAEVLDPTFDDADVARASCLSNLIYLHRADSIRVQELAVQARQVLKEAETKAPDNPRLAWIEGPNLWYRAGEDEELQKKAIEIYERGLQVIRAQKANTSDPLQPTWGEPELLMNLAWSNLHRKTPDLGAAQRHAQSALDLVPNWHYVRDILMPQIQKARDITEIQKLRDRDIAASKTADFETLKSLFTDDSVLMPPGAGFVRGRTDRERVMEDMRELTSQYDVLEYYEDFEELSIYGNAAIEWGTIRGEMRQKQTGELIRESYKVMRILAKEHGQWKISRVIFNEMPPAKFQ